LTLQQHRAKPRARLGLDAGREFGLGRGQPAGGASLGTVIATDEQSPA